MNMRIHERPDDFHVNHASRRTLLAGGVGVVAAARLSARTPATAAEHEQSSYRPQRRHSMSTIPPKTARRSTTRLGSGNPWYVSHGWPLSADAFGRSDVLLASRDIDCIAHDRRGMVARSALER